jgi:catechol 2,3-dioxygenase-like lactoylglutathione lyase family enzyme
MGLTQVKIVSVPVSDQDRARDFYVNRLGLRVVRDDPMGPDQRWVELAVGDGSTSLTLVTWFDAMPPGSCQGLVFMTSDLEQTVADLREQGVEFRRGIEDAPWGRQAVLYDPDGNGLVLLQEASV